MRAKNATIKPPRKAAQHHLRRAYESLGRIDILEASLAGSSYTNVSTLLEFAQQKLAADQPEDAAELLRAAEHLCFAALAPQTVGSAPQFPAELIAAVTAEFDNITHCAEVNWSESDPDSDPHTALLHGPVAAIYTTTLEDAHQAFAGGAYRPALQLARAAEALAKTAHRAFVAAHRKPHRIAS
jgi:hypothetical protein